MKSNFSVVQKEGHSITVDPNASVVTPAGLQPNVLTQPHPFLIPEILLNVFQYLSRDDLASSMRVCRSWPDVVAIVLWRNLDSLLPLMKVLASMTKKFEYWSFVGASDLRDANWGRFEYYANYVRILDNTRTRITEDASRNVHVALQSRSQRLLPNLQAVRLALGREVSPCELELSTSLISPTVHCLHFASNGTISWEIPPQKILQDLGVQDIPLTEFDLSVSGHFLFDPVLFKKDETLQPPGLQALSFHTMGFSRPPTPKHFFGEQHNLQKFSFSFAFIPREVLPFFESLVEMAPQLHTLECNCICKCDSSFPFSSLRPLLQLHRLSTLTISHVVELTIEDIQDMGRSWRSLTSFYYRPNQSWQSKTTDPPVSVLLAIAECFPPTFRTLEIKLRWEDNLPRMGDGERRVSSKIDSLAIDIERPSTEERLAALANLLAGVINHDAKIQTGRLKNNSDPFFYAPCWDQAATEKLELAVQRARCLSAE